MTLPNRLAIMCKKEVVAMMNYSELSETLDGCTLLELRECIIDLYSLSCGAQEQGLSINDLSETMRYRIEKMPLPSTFSLSTKEGK